MCGAFSVQYTAQPRTMYICCLLSLSILTIYNLLVVKVRILSSWLRTGRLCTVPARSCGSSGTSLIDLCMLVGSLGVTAARDAGALCCKDEGAYRDFPLSSNVQFQVASKALTKMLESGIRTLA